MARWVRIVFYKPLKRQQMEADGTTEDVSIPLMRTFCVFNAQQTNLDEYQLQNDHEPPSDCSNAYTEAESLIANTNALSNQDVAVRQVALRLLCEMDIEDESVLPAMIKALNDGNRTIRIAAAGFVTRFGEKAKAAIPIFKSWIGSNDELNRILAAGSILKIDPSKSGDLLPVLIDALNSDGIRQLEAIGQLERLGEMSQEAVPSLKRLLHENSTVSLQAADSIHAITGDPTDSIKLGVALLDHSEWLQRYVGCEHLGQLKDDARPAIPRLKWTVLDDENDAVRNRARVRSNPRGKYQSNLSEKSSHLKNLTSSSR